MTKLLVVVGLLTVCLMFPSQVKGVLSLCWDKLLKLIRVRQ